VRRALNSHSFWYNGAETISTTSVGGTGVTPQDYVFGAAGNSGGSPFKGRLALGAVWSVALTSAGMATFTARWPELLVPPPRRLWFDVGGGTTTYPVRPNYQTSPGFVTHGGWTHKTIGLGGN
jgi:hypothetical protein